MISNVAYADPRLFLTDSSSATAQPFPTQSVISPMARQKIFEPRRLRIILPVTCPEWFKHAVTRLEDLLNLQPNWDSYGANSVNPEIAMYAINLLLELMDDAMPIPSIVPTNRGGIQLEWHTTRGDLEIDIEAPYRVGVVFEDVVTGEPLEEMRVIDASWLQKALMRIAQH